MKVILKSLDGTEKTTKVYGVPTEIEHCGVTYKFVKFIGYNYDSALYEERLQEFWP